MLQILPLRLHYTSSAPMPVQGYSGSHWRSGFGKHLKANSCITGAATCHGCPVRQNCAYGVVFDAPQPSAAAGLNAQHPEQPNPYVLSPVVQTATEACVELTLLGPALPYAHSVVQALQQQQPNNGGGIWQLQALSQRPSPEPLWQPGQAWPPLQAHTPKAPAAPSALTIHLTHPLRLRTPMALKAINPQECLSPAHFSFAAFFTALVRRIQMLHGLSPSAPLADDFAALVQHAKTFTLHNAQLHWQDDARYSAHQKQKVPMGGLLGSFELHGNLAPLWPYLHLGQWLHVGKGTVMGLGRYHLSETL